MRVVAAVVAAIGGALCVMVVGFYCWAVSSSEASTSAPPRPTADAATMGEGATTVADPATLRPGERPGEGPGASVAGKISVASADSSGQGGAPKNTAASKPEKGTRAGDDPPLAGPAEAPTRREADASVNVAATEVPDPSARGDGPADGPATAPENAAAGAPSTPSAPEAPASAPADKTMYLTVPAMSRVRDTPVVTAPYDDSRVLNHKALHPEGTGFPWQGGANVYIAGHRLGYMGTGSFLLFYDLDALGKGDRILLRDSTGRTYRYVVYDSFTVAPGHTWVMKPHRGEDLLTLQSCTLPDFTSRLIVRARRAGGAGGEGGSPP